MATSNARWMLNQLERHEAQKTKHEATRVERRKYDAYDTPMMAADNIARKYPRNSHLTR